MAIAFVSVERTRRHEVDTEMTAQGFVTWIAATVSGKERLYKLPPGVYWMVEPCDPEDLRDRCRAALRAASVVSGQILVTCGPSIWDGLPILNGE